MKINNIKPVILPKTYDSRIAPMHFEYTLHNIQVIKDKKFCH